MPRMSSMQVGRVLVRHLVVVRLGVFGAPLPWVGEDGWLCWSGSCIWRCRIVWDDINTHVSARMAEPIASRKWLTVYRLSA